MTDGPRCIRHHDSPVLATTGYLCDHHDQLLQGWLADIDDWYLHHRVFRPSALTIAVTDTRAGWGDGSSGELDQDAPARTLAFRRHLNPLSGRLESNGRDVPDVPAVIDSWSQVLLEECPAVTVQPEAFAARVSLLQRHRLWIVEQPWLDEFLKDIRACQSALAKVVGEATGPRPLGPCLYCQTNVYSDHELELWASRREHRALHQRPEDRVSCQGCGAQWKGTEIVRLMLSMEAS